MIRSVLAALLFSVVFGCTAQQWELVTPIKSRSDLAGMRMTSATTGYTIDRALGHVMRTHDAGTSWERMASNLLDKPKALWMWDEQRGIIAANSGRFYHTVNGFDDFTTTLFPAYGNMSTIHFVNDTLGFAGTEAGRIFRSEDAGATWTEQVSGVPYNINSFFFVDTQLGFASALGSYLLRTTDGGANWEQLTPPDVVNIKDLHFFDAQHGIGVGTVGTIIRTNDGGDTWTFQTSPTTYSLFDLEVQGNVLVACGAWGHIIRSTDGGDSWTEQVVGVRDHFCTDINSLGIGLSGSEGGVYRTTDFGASWQPAQIGTAHSMLNKVSFGNDQMGATVGWVTMGGFESTRMRTTDGGRHWSGTVGSSGGFLGVHLRADGAGSYGGGVGVNGHTADYFATTSGGTSPPIAIRATWSFSPSTYIVAGGYVGAGFYRTTNSGATWDFTSGGNIYDLYFPSDLVGYAGGEGGVLEKTIDGGITWAPLTSPTTGEIFSVFFLNDTLGWISGSGAAHRTTDGGASWTMIGGLPQYTMSVFFTDADTGYAVSSSGYGLRSTDGGENWEIIVDAPFDAQISDGALADGALIAVGRFGDVFRAQIDCPLVPQVPMVLQANNELCVGLSADIQWYLDDEPVPGGNTPCIPAEVPGSYHVMVTDALGCVSAPSTPVQVISTGVAATHVEDLLLYPNPVRHTLTIVLPTGPHTVTIHDAQGRCVRSVRAMGGMLMLDVADLSTGLYMLRSDGGARAQRFVKE